MSLQLVAEDTVVALCLLLVGVLYLSALRRKIHKKMDTLSVRRIILLVASVYVIGIGVMLTLGVLMQLGRIPQFGAMIGVVSAGVVVWISLQVFNRQMR